MSGSDWLLARVDLSVGEAQEWFARLHAAGTLDASWPALHGLPAMSRSLGSPLMMLQVMPSVDSPASSLLVGVKRPVQGLIWAADERHAQVVPDRVELAGGRRSFVPATELAGIYVTSAEVPDELQTTQGVFVGRAERRAWLVESRGEESFEHYLIQIGWDPRRTDLSMLELTHVERLGLETVMSVRVALGDLGAAPDVSGSRRVTVKVPTVGRSVTHEVLLHTLEGELLDRSGPYPIAELVSLSITVDGQEDLRPTVIGATGPPPPWQERAGRLGDIEADMTELLASAAQARILLDRQSARQRLVERLVAATGELLVHDPYFGRDADDWRLLDGVGIPTRVLTCKLAKDKLPRLPAHVTAKVRAKAPMHERIYLWDGGGVALGGSPTTFGNAPVRMEQLRLSDVKWWRDEFLRLWESEHFATIPRKKDS